MPASASRILLTTFGSFGDLHPFIAVALELKARGHRPIIGTSEIYREKIEDLGLGFAPVRPNLPPLDEARDMIARVMDARTGTEYLFKQLLMPHLRESYDDIERAAADADLMVTHPITFAAPLVAMRRKIRWISTVLSPISLWSVHDPPAPPLAPFLARLRHLGAGANRALLRVIKRVTAGWVEPVQQLRADIGLPRGRHPLFDGQYSPDLTLALFSPVLATPQPDWPAHTCVTGFPFFDRKDAEIGVPAKLMQFLTNGPPPLIFTLGSSAVFDAGDFYRESMEAARLLRHRALLLIGDESNLPAEAMPEDIAVANYAPYSNVFPFASAIIHQGGVGTTGQALRAGKPMLFVPYSHDQPDNAARVERLGIGRTLRRGKYNAARAAHLLHGLINDDQCISRADEIGQSVRNDGGARAACDAIERLS